MSIKKSLPTSSIIELMPVFESEQPIIRFYDVSENIVCYARIIEELLGSITELIRRRESASFIQKLFLRSVHELYHRQKLTYDIFNGLILRTLNDLVSSLYAGGNSLIAIKKLNEEGFKMMAKEDFPALIPLFARTAKFTVLIYSPAEDLLFSPKDPPLLRIPHNIPYR